MGPPSRRIRELYFLPIIAKKSFPAICIPSFKHGKGLETIPRTTVDPCFKGSMSPTANVDDATEVVPVFVHGVLYESEVQFNADVAIKAVEKAALKQIIFGE